MIQGYYTSQMGADGGSIREWLVAGPVITEVPLSAPADATWRHAVAESQQLSTAGIDAGPVENGRLETSRHASAASGEHLWRVMRCGDDGVLDLTRICPVPSHLRTWAYAELQLDSPAIAEVSITTAGPATLWVNGERILTHVVFSDDLSSEHNVTVELARGTNELLIRFEQIGVGPCPYLLSMQIGKLPVAGCTIALPTTCSDIPRRAALQSLVDAAYLSHELAHMNDRLAVCWPTSVHITDEVTVRLQSSGGRTYVEGYPQVGPGTVVRLGPLERTPEGSYEVVLTPKPDDTYVKGLRARQSLHVYLVTGEYSDVYYGDFEVRRQEALAAAARLRGTPFGEIAKMELGEWKKVQAGPLIASLESVRRNGYGSGLALLGLLGAQMRYGPIPGRSEQPGLPVEVTEELANVAKGTASELWDGGPVLGPSLDAQQIVHYACQVLAGQHYADEPFFTSGPPDDICHGADVRDMGEARTLAWLRARAYYGWHQWHDPESIEWIAAALVHLVDFAQNDALAELAAVVLDKLLFSMATNSWRGVFGVSHAQVRAAQAKGGRAAATAPLSRLLWGQGVFNAFCAGSVSLACSRAYEMPEILAAIAVDNEKDAWQLEQMGLRQDEGRQTPVEPQVRTACYRTPEYMLACALDHRAGERGMGEHIWQATLGIDAVVFVTHPRYAVEAEGHAVNYWAGQDRLPRVVQWRDTLIAIHRLENEDRQPFTHAYFPAAAFDEFRLLDRWLFARKENSYIGLFAACGLDPKKAGGKLLREIRSYGRENIWVCQLGRKQDDGTFEDFMQAHAGSAIEVNSLSLVWQSPRQGLIRSGWDEEFTIEGVNPFATTDEPFQYMGPYGSARWPAEEMEIEFRGSVMQLSFS